MAVTESLILIIISSCFLVLTKAQTCKYDGEVQLSGMGFNTPDKGILFVCKNNKKHSLCSTEHDNNNAQAACRQLGFIEGRVVESKRIKSGKTFSPLIFFCTGTEDRMANGGCRNATLNNCESNRNFIIQCYSRFISFLSFESETDANEANHSFELPFPIQIGNSNVSTARIYNHGLISFGDYLLQPSDPNIDSYITLLPFFSWGHRLTFGGALYHTDVESYPFTIVNRFISNSTGEMFAASLILVGQWRGDSGLEFQAIVASNETTTRVIFTYLCVSKLIPQKADIGFNVPNYESKHFRYSDTPYSRQIGCINKPVDVDYFNLLYTLTERTSNGSQGVNPVRMSNCSEVGLLSGCCRPFQDPTKSCRSRGGCYCDSLCYRYNDCCPDVGREGLEKPCLPVCENGTVNKEGNTYFNSGVSSICVNGMQRYIARMNGGATFPSRGVFCQQIRDQINGSTNLERLSEQTLSQFFVDRDNLNCNGFEKTIAQCPFQELQPRLSREAAALKCPSLDTERCTNGEVMLEDSTSSSKGFLHICVLNKWRAVCTSIQVNAARVVCSHLSGHNSNNAVTVQTLPVNQQPPGITSFSCISSATSLANCSFTFDDCQQPFVQARIDCNDPSASNRPPPPTLSASTRRPTIMPSTPISSLLPSLRPTGTSSDGNGDLVEVVGYILGTLAGAVIIIVVTICLFIVIMKRQNKRDQQQLELNEMNESTLRYVRNFVKMTSSDKLFTRVETSLKLLEDFNSAGLIIDNTSLRLLDSIGQGEFGLVYKAHLFDDQGAPIDVAVKTLKGTYDQNDINNLLLESLKMKELSHQNVMSIIGVCLDAGTAPFIILPYMSGGSLHSYLQRNRNSIILTDDAIDPEQKVGIQLTSICLQIAKGMQYISSKGIIHRDLAARNCMLDHNGIIKVADFGLSKSLYEKLYYKQEKDETVKLPVKWMAIESINDGIFSEKSDVWSFGVTCWEVYSGGKVPYGGLSPMSIPKLLEEGHRMNKPNNNACCDNMYNEMMLQCWNASPEERPSFLNLLQKIERILMSMANYLDINQMFTLQEEESTEA
ncbi:PREDICTED: uncharacterized protein LOC100636458 isoform X2 [Amphimedon queenslandica]|uniref:Receptor protein-tyrosine kinase n=1 Tax=Amphimedon queenslandica TaxID=400682 RepID=A0A1X7UJF4_AMPQE|nr:PREDICTED: uncharacterized protein LOC100636458 isoform X2 [Amphimedon queenslandica]|eukprot:XP_019853754.1 PREDICTED: uncharacterized protein LOC100636458 isoform X2 [Amphimedon queenslandica]